MAEGPTVTKKKRMLTRVTFSQVIHSGQSISGQRFFSSLTQMVYKTLTWVAEGKKKSDFFILYSFRLEVCH